MSSLKGEPLEEFNPESFFVPDAKIKEFEPSEFLFLPDSLTSNLSNEIVTIEFFLAFDPYKLHFIPGKAGGLFPSGTWME